MSVPTWSGDEHTIGTFRYRVLWFRVLLVAGVTTGLVGAFGMGHAVGQRAPTPGLAATSAPADPVQRQAKTQVEDDLGGYDVLCQDGESHCESDERPSAPLTPSQERELLEEARARAAEARAAQEAQAAKNAPLLERLETSKISLNFDAQPMSVALDFLRDVTRLNFVVSSEARDLIKSEEIEVSLRLKDISLVNALQLILAADESLTYRVRKGVVLILTSDEAEAESELELEAYAVEDIVSGALQGKGGASVDADLLVELTEEILDEDEGSLEYTAGPEGDKATLLVRRSAPQQARVRRLLSYLRTLERSRPAQPKWINDYEALLANRKVTLNFRSTPLADVVDFLQDITGLNLVISSGVDSDRITVDLRLREVSLEDALDVILEQTRLARSFVNETLLIHDLADVGSHRRYDLQIRDVRDLCTWLDPDVIQEIVQDGTGEEHWDEPASLDVHRGQLFVRQTRAQQARVDEFLAKLRVSRVKNAETRSSK